MVFYFSIFIWSRIVCENNEKGITFYTEMRLFRFLKSSDFDFSSFVRSSNAPAKYRCVNVYYVYDERINNWSSYSRLSGSISLFVSNKICSKQLMCHLYLHTYSYKNLKPERVTTQWALYETLDLHQS